MCMLRGVWVDYIFMFIWFFFIFIYIFAAHAHFNDHSPADTILFLVLFVERFFRLDNDIISTAVLCVHKTSLSQLMIKREQIGI
jgi:hypothetical protein